MTQQASKFPSLSTLALRLGLCAAAVVGAAVPMSDAQAIVVTFSTPISVTNSFDGLYVKLSTGVTGGTGATTAGWEFQDGRHPHTLGFRFYNESTASINYGYVSLTSAGPTGFPLTINSWSFENSGAAISTPVPEASTTAMFSLGALALGALNLRRLRRERKAA